MSTFDVIIPAGGEIDETFAKVVGTSSKALIMMDGQTVLARVIGSLRESGRVARIAVIGPEAVLEAAKTSGADLLLEPGSSGPDNIMLGLGSLSKLPGPSQKVIVSTCDLPFLSPSIIARFLDMCPDADITLPLVERTDYQARFPNSSSTFIPLKDGVWTAGNLYLLDSEALRKAKPHIDRIFKVRKSKVGMARLLGIRFVIKFLNKSLTIEDLERKIVGMLDCSGKAVMESPPELAYDMDDLEDYEYAMKHIGAAK